MNLSSNSWPISNATFFENSVEMIFFLIWEQKVKIDVHFCFSPTTPFHFHFLAFRSFGQSLVWFPTHFSSIRSNSIRRDFYKQKTAQENSLWAHHWRYPLSRSPLPPFSRRISLHPNSPHSLIFASIAVGIHYIAFSTSLRRLLPSSFAIESKWATTCPDLPASLLLSVTVTPTQNVAHPYRPVQKKGFWKKKNFKLLCQDSRVD